MDRMPRSAEILARVRSWVDGAAGLTMSAGDRITVEGDPASIILVSTDQGDLVLTRRIVEAGASPERIEQVRRAIAAFGDDGDMDAGGGTVRASLTTRIAGSRLNHHAVLGAVYGLATAVEPPGDEPAPDEPADEPRESDQAETEPTRELERVWAPTHTVPAGGLPAWPTPDGTQAAPVRLEAGVVLAVAETRGDWARVTGENGWAGWVDRRRLEPRRGPRRPVAGERSAAPPATQSRMRPLPLLGLFALGVSVILPWWDDAETTLNALEVPLAVLWDYGASQPPQLAWLLVVLALAAVVPAFTDMARGLYIPTGLVLLATPLLFVAQVYRGVVDAGSPASDTFRLIGYAPLVAFIAGLLLLASAKR